jgi:hypothetical protein
LSERRKMTGVVEEVWVPLSLGCSTLGAEQEQVGEEWNDLFQILLPSLGSDLSLIYQDRLSTWWFGGMRLWFTCARV